MLINEMALIETPFPTPENCDLHRLTINNCGRQFLDCDTFEGSYLAPRYDMQLIYCVRGPISCLINGEDRQIPTNSFVIYKTGERRRFSYAQPMELFWIHFHGDYFAEIVDELFPDNERVIQLSGPNYKIADLFCSLISYMKFHPTSHNLTCCGLLFEIFGNITKQERSLMQDAQWDSIRPAIKYIEENYNRRISIDELATVTNLSKSHFHKCFKNLTNTTPYNYQLSLCLYAAREYLESSDLTVSDIAERVGFSDPLAFSRSFKKKYGLSPRHYRQSISK